MQPAVKERHLSHGLSAQHETTYFAGTLAMQATDQPGACGVRVILAWAGVW
jgi:hypothetical protein